MSDERKACTNCKYSREGACSDAVMCVHSDTPTRAPHFPRSQAEQFYCCYWAEREPTEYTPHDRPVWAQRTVGGRWMVNCGCVNVNLVDDYACAKWNVDMLNRICLTWARGRHVCATCGKQDNGNPQCSSMAPHDFDSCLCWEARR